MVLPQLGFSVPSVSHLVTHLLKHKWSYEDIGPMLLISFLFLVLKKFRSMYPVRLGFSDLKL